MGHEIVYCANCQIRLTGLDFEKEKAFRIGLTVTCLACLETTLAAARPADAAAFRGRATPSQRIPSTSRIRIQAPGRASRRPVVLAALAAALAVLIIAAVLARPARPTSPPAVAPPIAAPVAPPPVPADTAFARQAKAAEALAALDGRAEALIAAERYRDAAALYEAATDLDPAVRRQRLADLRRRADAVVERPAPVPVPSPAPAPPPPAAPTEAWKAAMARATARRFDEALASLEGDDLALLKDVKALHEEGLRALAALAPGAAVSLRVRAADGQESDVAGVVRRAGPRRVELEGGVYVEAVDLTARSLVALAPAPKPRAAAAAGLIDGDPSAAADGLPEKYAAWAREAAAFRPKPEAAELALRARFYEAERAYADEERRWEAALLYRDLLREDAPLLRDETARIRARGEIPRETFFTASRLSSGGSFRFVAAEKAETAWVCGEGVEDAARNFIELDFLALPELTYKLWAYVGGCCAETFTFGTQVDDVRKFPVPHGILFLKKTHAIHGGRREPKRWEWVAIPLPKFAAAGLHKVRIFSGQEGFGVAAAVVSTVRTAAPGDAETREQLRKVTLPSKPVDPNLLAWWKLDEGQGRVAVDASGRGGHGTAQGARWREAEGRSGLFFDGVDDGLSSSATPDATESFTLAFWARPEGERTSTPEETTGVSGTKDQRYAIFPAHGGESGRAGLGVSVGRNGVSVFEHADSHMPSLLVHDAPIAGWVHVAVVVVKGQPRLFLEGLPVRAGLASTKQVFAGGQLSTSDYGRYAGLLADVRIFKTPLSDAEIRKLRGLPELRR
jgi:hypothetical protein